MSWWDRFRFRDWPRPPRPPDVTLDLSVPALGLLRLEQTAASVRPMFGPPASWRFYRDHGMWLYPELGVTLRIERDTVKGFGLSFDVKAYPFAGEADRKFTPGPFRILLPGAIRESQRDEWSPAFARQRLGNPSIEEEDEGELILTYERDTWAMEFEFPDARKLAHVEVYAIE